MTIELIDFGKTFDVPHPAGAIFTMKHWTNAMQGEVDRACVTSQNGQIGYDISREREMKIDLSVVGWKGVTIDGQEVPCTSENKSKLPVGVTLWLQREIEERAGMRITTEEKKN